MIFGKKRDWQDSYDEDYVRRSDRADRLGRKPRTWIHVLALGFVGFVFLGAIGVVSGQTMFEKTLIAMVYPTGIIWLLLIAMVYFSLIHRQMMPAIFGLLCWLVLTVFGNSFVANQLARYVEHAHLSTNPVDTDAIYDAVFVLGGGTETNLQGNSQAGEHGDRVVLAARMYHAGKAKLLVTTGEQSFRSTKTDLDPYQEAKNILVGLGVPSRQNHKHSRQKHIRRKCGMRPSFSSNKNFNLARSL